MRHYTRASTLGRWFIVCARARRDAPGPAALPKGPNPQVSACALLSACVFIPVIPTGRRMGSEVRARNGSFWQERGKKWLYLGYRVGKFHFWIWSGSLSASKKKKDPWHFGHCSSPATWGLRRHCGKCSSKKEAPERTWSFEKNFRA